MTIRSDSSTIYGGLLVVRHFDDILPVDGQCGPVSYYDGKVRDLAQNNLEYYNLADGTNKYLKHGILHIYAYNIDYPADAANFLGSPRTEAFCCFNDGNANFRIIARYLDPNNGNDYRYPASLSHEFGHGWHNWGGLQNAGAWADELRAFYTRRFLKPGVTTYPTGYNVWEAFANAWRCDRGVQATRGVPDVPDTMENPNNHPEWRKQDSLLPELCAYAAKYGIQAGTLSWQGGENGYWQFKQADGTWIAQVDYYNWQEWVQPNVWSAYAWYRFYPEYTRL